jgi:hypothetical protein
MESRHQQLEATLMNRLQRMQVLLRRAARTARNTAQYAAVRREAMAPQAEINALELQHQSAGEVRLFWRAGEPAGRASFNFIQVGYQPISSGEPPDPVNDLGLALEGLLYDCAADIDRVLEELDGAARFKVYIRIEYRKQHQNLVFTSHFSTVNDRFFRRDGRISNLDNPYVDDLRRHTDQILQHNARMIREQSGHTLHKVGEMTLKFSKYNPLGGGCFAKLPYFIKVNHHQCLSRVPNE